MPTKPKTPQEQNANVVQGRDLFLTPNYATDIIINHLPYGIKNIWECASAGNKMSFRFKQRGFSVYESDIRLTSDNMFFHNFVLDDFPANVPTEDIAIVTNPPYSLKQKFYKKCMEYWDKYGIPFALLIPADYAGWIIQGLRHEGAEKIIPERRIDYITPNKKDGKSGSSAQFHSMWLTKGFYLDKSETFVESSIYDKKENI